MTSETLLYSLFITFWVSLGINSIYQFLIYPQLIWFKSTLPSHKNSVSVIIAAHNEATNLRELLNTISTQDHHDFEIIVVNDRSNDGTYEILETFKKDLKNLIVIHIKTTPDGITPKKHALTTAINTSTKNVLLFTDGDCIPHSDTWIKEMTSKIGNETEIALGYSPLNVKTGLLGLMIRFETFLTGIRYLSFANIGIPYMGVGRNLAYAKNIFLKKNGFDTHKNILGGDDDLFVQKASTRHNTTIAISPKSMTTSPGKTSWKDWYNQKKRHLNTGKSYNKLIFTLLFLESLSLFTLYISSLYLLVSNYEIQTILVTILLRTLLLFTTFTLISIRFKQKSLWILLIPMLEPMYLLYTVVLSFSVICSKRVRWN